MKSFACKIDKQNEKGKATIQMFSLSKSRRKNFFLLCGSCNVVSIAGNAATEEKAGADNKDMPDEKRCIGLGEGQNDDIRTTYHNEEKSNLRLEFKDLDKSQSVGNGRQGQTMERHEGITKICWSRSDNDDEVDGQSGVESFVEQKWSELPRNNLKQQLHEAEDWEGGKDARMQQTASPKRRAKLITKRIACYRSAEPSKGQSQVLVENEPPSPPLMKDSMYSDKSAPSPPLMKDSMYSDKSAPSPPLMKDSMYSDKSAPSPPLTKDSMYSDKSPPSPPLTKHSMYSGKQASYKPESKTNDAAWVEKEPGATGTPANRWKRLASLKFKLNRIDGKRMERDDATIHEEYEMMMENLKMYGVL